MRKNVLIFLLLLLSAVSFSQKIPVHLVRKDKDLQWQILDEVMGTAFPGSEVFSDDSITFTLDIEKRYFFSVSFNHEYKTEENLFILYIADEPVIRINGDTKPGDHFLPFFTGVRDQEKKIFGGTDALISEYPWQVYLVAGNLACGGSIIGNNWILTAAHCTRDQSGNTWAASKVTVKAGANNPYDPSQGTVYQAAEVIPHEAYNDNTLENDIALIRLTSPITNPNTSVVHLVTQEDIVYGAIDPGVMSWVTGWGLTHKNPNVYPTSLQKVQLPLITNLQASTVWHSIPSTVIMAGYLNGNKDACNGDSGGPLVVPVLGEYRQAGLVSWGSSDCNTYGAYTNVALFETWIRDKTGIQPFFRPPAPKGDSIICAGTASDQYIVSEVPGATSYEWGIFPSSAGSVSSTSTTATVNWNLRFTGTADLAYRVTRSGQLSDWSRIRLKVVQNTRITRVSADTSLCASKTASLSVNTQGYNLQYRWFNNGNPLPGDYAGRLEIPAALPGNSGNYTVQVSGKCGTVLSSVMHLTVYPLTEIRSLTPAADLSFGSDKELHVSAGGNNLSFQWEKDSVALAAATDSTLMLKKVTAGDIGLYRVVVSGTCGTKTSGNIYVFVTGNTLSGAPEVLLWPSITNDFFNVAESEGDFYNINIYNQSGKLMLSRTNLQYQEEIDLSHLGKGIYFVTIYNNKFRKTIKVLKT